MCFNNNQPKPPKPQLLPAPPPVKPLKIASTSKLESRVVEPEKKKQIQYGSKSGRDASRAPKRDAASLLVPINTGNAGGTTGGINT
jgi:hypothetical protein